MLGGLSKIKVKESWSIMSREVKIAGNTVVLPDIKPSSMTSPRWTGDIIEFFREKSKPENGPEFENYADYEPCARALQNALNQVAEFHEDYRGVFIPLMLKPEYDVPEEIDVYTLSQEELIVLDKETNPAVISDGNEPPGTTALTMLAYRLTNAKPVIDTRDYGDDERGGSGEGKIFLQGVYKNKPVVFMENYGRDSQGGYMTWQLTGQLPEQPPTYQEALLSARRVSKTEQVAMYEDVMDVIEFAGRSAISSELMPRRGNTSTA